MIQGSAWCLLWVGVAAATADGARPSGGPQFVPRWSADAVWYQVFVSRFANGDLTNDPPGTLPWTDHWAQLETGEAPPLRHRLFDRRYGGDLRGLLDKLPYLKDLGVNTLYLNPVFHASSEHKYDTADHRHIDDSYGVSGSRRRLARETADPATWQWSDSDRLFLDFLAEAHAQGIRVVLDGVFNHVGPEFWAWRDVRERGPESPHADWFDVTDWGPPLRWRAWDGPNGRLVNFKQAGDGLHPEVERYLFAVVRRWMDPNGNGDPSDGIDGWRLDAAEKLPGGFWRRFRRIVKQANPEAVIVGEIWTGAWLSGDQFDVVTNYPFSAPLMRFLNQGNARYPPTKFGDDLTELYRAHAPAATLGMLNLLGSHDTERAVTMLSDPRRHATADGRLPERDLLKPDADAYARLRLAALVQFTWPGAPMLYYGDEVGMYGGDDPFCRAPMWWSDARPAGFRADLLEFYQELGRLRRTREELRRGRLRLILVDDARRLIAFSRRDGKNETIVIVNGDTADHRAMLTVGRPGQTLESTTFSSAISRPGGSSREHQRVGPDGRLQTNCPRLSGQVIRLTAAVRKPPFDS